MILDSNYTRIGLSIYARKTSGYLGLESHFHADAKVRI